MERGNKHLVIDVGKISDYTKEPNINVEYREVKTTVENADKAFEISCYDVNDCYNKVIKLCHIIARKPEAILQIEVWINSPLMPKKELLVYKRNHNELEEDNYVVVV